jgi:xanthine dehydrogenase small subunit
MTAVRFLLNGEPRAEDRVPPTMTVLDWLRTVARLTGTKEGCAEGDCGACTIAIARPGDGAPRYQAVNSCLMMFPQIDGYSVLTVEGLAHGASLHPVQQALVDADATQCGFCTPGFVMAMFAFRQGGEPPDDENIHEALAGNLCRCTGYRSIVEACRRVARQPDETEAPNAAVTRDASSTGLAYRNEAQVFLAPRTLDELLKAKEEYPDAVVLAGGTDLGLRVSKDDEAIPVVISTGAVAELQQIEAGRDGLEIGGGVTYSAALPFLDNSFLAFGTLVRRIGSRQIRNLGTFAGNLATASPIGDTLPVLVALDASVALASRDGRRTMPVESFITGYRQTAMAPNEVIAGIRIPALQGKTLHVYKVSKRFDQDISTVIAAFVLMVEDGRVKELRAAYGGMASRPARASHLEQALIDRAWVPESLADVDALIAQDFAPLSDHRGGAAYRLHAAAGLVRRLLYEATSSAPIRLEAL